MANITNLDKGFMEGVEIRVLELIIVKSKKVVHDDVASQGGERMGEVERLSTLFKLMHTTGKRVDMAVNNMDEVDD